MIAIEIPRWEVEIGGQLKATATWQVEGRRPEAVELKVGWRTEGRGMVDAATVGERRVDLEDDAFATPWATIEITIPDGSPVSYDGQLIRVLWLVEARLDIPWARDERHEEFFRVAPTGALAR